MLGTLGSFWGKLVVRTDAGKFASGRQGSLVLERWPSWAVATYVGAAGMQLHQGFRHQGGWMVPHGYRCLHYNSPK